MTVQGGCLCCCNGVLKGSQIEEAAKCLYLAEVVLIESAVPAKEPSSLFNRSSESCRGQLVTVLGESSAG